MAGTAPSSLKVFPAALLRTGPLRTLTGMSRKSIIASRTAMTRRCPECGRGMALTLNPYYGVRYCRWAAEGKCTLTEARAVEERPRAYPGA